MNGVECVCFSVCVWLYNKANSWPCNHPSLSIYGNMSYLYILFDEIYCGFCPLMSYLMPWKPIWETSHPTTLCRSDRNWLQVSEKSIVVTFSTWSHGFYPGLGIQIQHIIYYNMHRFSNMSTGKKIHPKKIRTDKPLSTCVCVIRPHKGAWWAGCVIRLPQGNSWTIHQAFREWWEKSIESF